MAFKIFDNTDDWNTKQAEYHAWMEDNIEGYNADFWAKSEWNKHPGQDKWHLLIPKGHPDTGEELSEDWFPEIES